MRYSPYALYLSYQPLYHGLQRILRTAIKYAKYVHVLQSVCDASYETRHLLTVLWAETFRIPANTCCVSVSASNLMECCHKFADA